MNFLGMGMPELAVIFLVAFLVLGPSKSIEMARTAGKVLGDLRRTFSEVIAATIVDPEHLNVSDPTATGPKTNRSAPTRSGSKPKDSSDDSAADSPNDSNGVGRQ